MSLIYHLCVGVGRHLLGLRTGESQEHFSPSVMPLEVYIQEMNLKPGVCIKVTGDTLPNAELFRINIGKDEFNLGLHFNPGFNYLFDYHTIVCNARIEGQRGKEQRERNFPFVPGTTVEVQITFNEEHYKVRMHDGYEFTFPNHLKLTTITYLSMCEDFNVQKVAFE